MSQTIQQARADFVVNRFREKLPASSLWHEKRFALGQLESLAIASSGGLYYVDTFDASRAQRGDVVVIDDVAIRILHEPDSHTALDNEGVRLLIQMANSEFNALLASGCDATAAFRRVTCNIEFKSTSGDVELNGRKLLDRVADQLGFPLTHVPFEPSDIFLPTSRNFYESQAKDYASIAGEFIFEERQPVERVTHLIQSVVQSHFSLLPPGIHGTIRGLVNVDRLHFVGRFF